ncbi:MAG: cation:proton antiporter [Nitrospirae bacterium]|nr:cation:proton antiporter [Nitrospirota bacterium]
MQDTEVTILRELIILLAVSLPITFLFHKAKLPALVGFLITGVLIGPYGAAVITETQVVERLAEIGVVLLLFTVGLEFSIEDIWRSGRQLLLGGGTQVVLTVGAVAGIALLFDYPMTQALFFGFLASLSSTAIVLKMYSDRAELDTAHGRLSTGILLFQDMAVVPMMLLLPVLGQAGTAGEITPVSVIMSLGMAVLGLAVVFLAARQIVPFLLHHVIRLRNREMFFLLVVLLCLGTAWITFSLGLSLALGAFLAGLIIAESEYSHQIVADILPFRDYFASIFFISIGMLLKTDRDTGKVTGKMSLAQFQKGGNIREIDHPLFTVNRQELQAPPFHVRFPLGGLGGGFHMISEQGRNRRGSALEGDMGPLDFFFQGQPFHDQVLGGPRPGRAVTDLPRVGLGVVDEFFKSVPGSIGPHHQPVKIDRVLHDRGEVIGRIIGDLAHMLTQDRPAGENPDGVPVGLLGFQGGHGHGRGPARFVHDHDGLPQGLAGGGNQRPGADICCPPRRVTDNEVNRFCGVLLLSKDSPRDTIQNIDRSKDRDDPKSHFVSFLLVHFSALLRERIFGQEPRRFGMILLHSGPPG